MVVKNNEGFEILTLVSMVPGRLPLRKSQECSGCIEFSTLKLLKFTCIICTVDLSIHNLRLYEVGTGTKITFVYINTAHQKLSSSNYSIH
jgi:hypothetical protein